MDIFFFKFYDQNGKDLRSPIFKVNTVMQSELPIAVLMCEFSI